MNSKQYHKERYLKHKEKEQVRARKRYQDNKESIIERQREYNKKYISQYKDTLKYRYNSYRSSARIRNVAFKISLEQFKTFWQKDCTYCHGEIKTIGLDRVDNLKGYVEGNLTACCAECNYTKSDYFMYNEMIEIIGPAIAKVKAKRIGSVKCPNRL